MIEWGAFGGVNTVVGSGALAAALWVYAAWHARRVHHLGLRVALIVLRTLVLACVWLVIASPQRRVERREDRGGHALALMDASRSMSLPGSERSRFSRLKDAIFDRLVALQSSGWAVGRLGAADGVASDLVALWAMPDGLRTDFERALKSAASANGSEVQDVVMFSDGRSTSDALDAAALAELPFRVHTVLVGDDDALSDDSIVSLQADPVALAGQTISVQASLRSFGHAPHPLRIWIERDGQRVVEQNVTPDVQGSATVELRVPAPEIGHHAFTLRVEHASHDMVPQNDQRTFTVEVRRDRLRVLLVCGHPSWDQRYMRAFLKSHAGIELVSFFILRNATDFTFAAPSELSLIPFPTDELFEEHLASFDIIIFQNFNYEPYEVERHLPRLRAAIEGGSGFVMIGGPLSFAGGGYAQTPLAQALPVRLGSEDDGYAETTFHVEATDATAHPILMRSLADASEHTWSTLSPFHGINRVIGLQGRAQVLLTRAATHEPALVVGDYGRGRVVSFLSDGSWRWAFDPNAEGVYERFWDTTLRWVARDPELAPSTLAAPVVGDDSMVTFEGRARDAAYRGLAAAEVVVTKGVTGTETRPTELLRTPVTPDADGQFRLTIPLRDIANPLWVELWDAGHHEVLARRPFVMDDGSVELADPRPDDASLRAIARATGGEFYASLDDALQSSVFERARSVVVESRRAPLLSDVLMAAMLAVLLSVEWVLRRRVGLR